jgi:quinol monooxygenase YgiN
MEVQGDPGHFLTYEVWKDRPALDAHMKTPAMAAAGPKLIPLLAKPFTQTFLDALT